MNTELRTELQEICLQDLQCALEEAHSGRLAPHWETYVRRNAVSAQESGYFPPEGDALLDALDEAVAAVPQLTDKQLATAQVNENGDDLLYYYSCKDYGTLMEVIRAGGQDKFTADVYIDKEAAGGDLSAYAAGLGAQLREWALTQQPDFDETCAPAYRPGLERPYYDTLSQALLYMFSLLHAPENAVC